MEIIDYFTSDKKDHWLGEILKSNWSAGKYLYELLSFCTYAEQDEVREPSLTPWVGFVYTLRRREK